MIDFTACEINKFKGYGGANGNKINIMYNGESYMLKFPPLANKNKDMSYSNSCVSEYIACHIFEMLGITAQKTLLGTYTDSRGKEKKVVACKDFTADGKRLMEFAHLKNTCVDSEQNGYGKDLPSILNTIEEQSILPPEELKEFFWDMFIADALLGNFDRHNGNWGILIDEKAKCAEIAPIYDCGSCLYPQLLEEDMDSVLKNEAELNKRIYTFPKSAIEENGTKLSYIEFISSGENKDCTKALDRMLKRIDMDKISEFIDNEEDISAIQKDFFKTMIWERKEKILDYSMAQLLEHGQKPYRNLTM